MTSRGTSHSCPWKQSTRQMSTVIDHDGPNHLDCRSNQAALLTLGGLPAAAETARSAKHFGSRMHCEIRRTRHPLFSCHVPRVLLVCIVSPVSCLACPLSCVSPSSRLHWLSPLTQLSPLLSSVDSSVVSRVAFFFVSTSTAKPHTIPRGRHELRDWLAPNARVAPCVAELRAVAVECRWWRALHSLPIGTVN